MDMYFYRIKMLMNDSANRNLQSILDLLDKCYCIAGNDPEDRKKVHDLANKVQQKIFLEMESA